MSAPLRYEAAVGPDTPGRVARAVVRWRLTSVAFAAPVAVLAVLAVVFALAGQVWLAVVVGAVAVLSVLSLRLRVPALARQLAARGFVPDTTIAVEYGPAEFTVVTARGSAVHAYVDVRDVRDTGGVVGIRMQRAGLLVVLPSALVPGDARRLLAGPH
jgi:hypothetical protein